MKNKDKSKLVYLLSFLAVLCVFINMFPKTSFTSHNKEPKVGDKVLNNNPSCKHFKSVGTVTKINSLSNDKGKTITYKVENDGSTYCVGQTLTKTMDQLTNYT